MAWQQGFRSPRQSLSLMWRRRLLRRLRAQPHSHAHQRFALLAGDVVSEEIWVAGLYEMALLVPLFDTLLNKHRATFARQVALDVGANIGNHSLFFSRYFARVLAIEPNPDALALLRCNVALARANHVEVMPVGLGESNGRFAFVQNDSGNLGGSHFVRAGAAPGAAVQCELRRGDDLLHGDLAQAAIGLVKLDIEGAELGAINGLAETLRRCHPVVLFESNRTAGETGGAAVMARLRELGYAHFWSVEEVGQGSAPWRRLLRRLIWGECINIAPIKALQDRPYSMLVAMPDQAP